MSRSNATSSTAPANRNDDPQSRKRSLIREARAQAASSAGGKKAEAALMDEFTAIMYERVAAEDLNNMDADTLSGAAVSLWNFAKGHKPGGHKIRVYNPVESKHGWHLPRTVVEIVNDDMPFIIDSISQEIARRELNIHLLVHPVIRVRRNKAGNATEIADTDEAPDSMATESLIHLEIGQLLTMELREDLEAALSHILDDVRAATMDWQPILAKLRHAIGEIDTTPAPVKPAELDEAKAFLRYMHDDNFTLLGYREYRFSKDDKGLKSEVVADSGLGILRNDKRTIFEHPLGPEGLPTQIETLEMQAGIIVVNKLNLLSTVHRRVPLDAVSLKQFDAEGNLCGEKLFVGLFTSVTYSRSVTNVPFLRKKVAKIHELAGFRKNTHDDKALTHILEKYPRDELFQITIPKLLEIVLGILRLQERPHLALFTRRDHFERFVSCLIYVPREQYKTELRRQMQDVLELEMDGKCTNFYTTLDDSPLARVLFFISTRPGKVPDFDAEAIQAKLTALATAWPERLRSALIKSHGDDTGIKLAHKYARAFSTEYTEKNGSKGAVYDIEHIEKLLGHDDNRIGLDLYQTSDTTASGINLKIYHANTPVPLSDMLPMLENMGLRVISEQPFNVDPAGVDASVWVHDFSMSTAGGEEIDIAEAKENFEDTLGHIWAGHIENDGFNRLALTAGLNYREITVLRAYSRFLRQAGYVFGQRYMEQVLAEWSPITRTIVELFLTRNDPSQAKSGKPPKTDKIENDIEAALEEVSQLDHDRILRSFLALVKATLRTNYFQTNDDDGRHKDFLSFKFDSLAIADLPQPRPMREIFVYSPRMEGVHLRGGLIARGGIRWSDRPEDFRTEILGLMKAQMVKNSVIVPVGAKGGFILKKPPKTGGRAALQEEGVTCYKMLVRALLDITDNNKGGKVVHPKNVVRHDGDDPYLVVAADKGTATFSDIANEIAEEYGFWLGDAFASGGSSGYDHKKMGITARGAWESVKRHFREMGTDIQSEDFSVIGVGDMGGDVFGNGMLLSKHIRLVGAFNHLHIFCDPDPDPAETFKERRRLFKAVKGWDAYDTKKLSKGGRIYERSAKSLELTPEIKKAFGISKARVTPAELIRAMLRAETDLLWFGGIGTYIKSSDETHAAAGDKTNDSLRVDADEVNARVIGEGANLGVTQKGRIEFGLRGGRLNTDFIDNSGGVDASDHEVNIKILLSDVMSGASSKLTRPARDKLLEKMTEEVAGLVLANNYRQGQCISLAQNESVKKANVHMQFIRDLEREGTINRRLEGLPDDETVDQRLRKGLGLTRPELSVLVSYAKIMLFNELQESKLSDEDTVIDMLMGYFPKPLQKDYATQIKRHKLRREIISTELANSVVNRLGPVFVKSRMETTGASACDIVRGYVIARDVLGLTPLWAEIEALDNKAPSKAQLQAMTEAQHMAERAITWFMVNRIGKPMDVAKVCALYGPGIKKLQTNLPKVLGPETRAHLDRRSEKLVAGGLPADLAKRVAAFPVMGSAFDVVRIADECKGDILATAEIYFGLGERLHFGWLRDQAEHMASDDHWQSLALAGLVDDFYACQSHLTKAVIDEMGTPKKDGAKLLEQWFVKHERMLRQLGHLLGEVSAIQHMDLSMLTVAEQRLRALAGRKDVA